jgi:signal peptidase I
MNQELIDKLARTPQSTILSFALVLTIYRLAIHPYLMKTAAHRRGFVYKFANFLSDFFDSLIYASIFIFFVIRPYFFQTFMIPTGSMLPTLKVNDYIVLNKIIYRYTEPKRGDIVVFRPPVYACNPGQLLPDGTVNSDFVKRLIGLPGDKIEMRQGQMFVNDKPLYEPYKQLTQGFNETYSDFRLLTEEEKTNWPKSNWKLVKYKGRLIPLNYTEFDANSSHPRSENGIGYPYSVVPEFYQEDPKVWDELKALPAESIPPSHFLFMGDNRNGSSDGRSWGLIERRSIVGRADVIWLPVSRLGKPQIVNNGTKPLPNAEFSDSFKQ